MYISGLSANVPGSAKGEREKRRSHEGEKKESGGLDFSGAKSTDRVVVVNSTLLTLKEYVQYVFCAHRSHLMAAKS